jgi:WD40 repeat protein
MKQIFIACLIVLLCAVNIYAQDSGEYLYNPVLAMSDDGLIIAVSGRSMIDSTARLGFRAPIDFFDTTTGNLISSFNESEDPISGLTLNSDGSLLAYSNMGGRLAIVDVATGTETNLIKVGGVVETGRPVWSPDEEVIASYSPGTLDIFDINRPRFNLTTFYNELTAGVLGFDWAEDTNVIVYSTRNAETDKGILVVVEVLPNFEMQMIKAIDAPAAITVVVRDDGSAVAINTQDGILVINLEDDSQLLLPKADLRNPILSLDWHPDGTKIVSGGNGTVTAWDIETAEIVASITTESIVKSVIWSPDGQYIYHTGGAAGIYRNGIPLREAIAADAESD